MGKNVISQSGGVLEHTHVRIDDPTLGEVREFLVEASMDTLEQLLTRNELIAKRVLHRDGMPTDLAPREVGKDKFENVLAMVEDDPWSEAWYAAQILKWARATREFLRQGRAEDAAFAAYQIADTYWEAWFKFGWEKHAARGAGVQAGGKKGGEARGREVQAEAKSRHDEWQRFADEYWSRHPKASKKEVATWISTKTGGKFKPDSIAKRIERPKPAAR